MQEGAAERADDATRSNSSRYKLRYRFLVSYDVVFFHFITAVSLGINSHDFDLVSVGLTVINYHLVLAV